MTVCGCWLPGLQKSPLPLPKRALLRLGFDNQGTEEEIRMNEVKIHDESNCMCLEWRHRLDVNQKGDCLCVKKKTGKNWTKGWKF